MPAGDPLCRCGCGSWLGMCTGARWTNPVAFVPLCLKTWTIVAPDPCACEDEEPRRQDLNMEED